MTTPKNKRLPKARVMYAYYRDGDGLFIHPKKPTNSPTVRGVWMRPLTAAKARQIVKAAPFLTMTEEEQVERLAAVINPGAFGSHKCIRVPYADTLLRQEAMARAVAILAAINGAK